VLGRVFGVKRVGVLGQWRKLHNKELNDLYSLTGVIRMMKSKRMRWVVHVAQMGRRGMYSLLVRKSKGKRPLGRHTCEWITLRWILSR
jgi:hypothetical protein